MEGSLTGVDVFLLASDSFVVANNDISDGFVLFMMRTFWTSCRTLGQHRKTMWSHWMKTREIAARKQLAVVF